MFSGKLPGIGREYFNLDFSLYLFCLYHSVLFFGINEIGPVNKNEMVYCIFAIIFIAILSNNVLGEVAVLYTYLRMKDIIYQDKIDTANEVMNKI